jgi:hypothetical protein
LGHSERNIKLTIPPNSVAELSWKGFSKSNRPPDAPALSRVTVFLDAAPRRVRRNSPPSLSFADQLQLLGALTEVLEHVPSAAVRLVAFSLDRQKELFRRDDFRVEDLNQVADALNDLRLGLVESAVLKNPGGRVQLLTRLINQEIHEPDAARLVIVLGPEQRYGDKVPAEFLDEVPASGPRFFYLQCKPAPIIPLIQEFDLSQSPLNGNRQAVLAPLATDYTATSNVIQSAMKRVQGETFSIYTPGQFAKAVEHIQQAALSRP